MSYSTLRPSFFWHEIRCLPSLRGQMMTPVERLIDNGYDAQFGINVLVEPDASYTNIPTWIQSRCRRSLLLDQAFTSGPDSWSKVVVSRAVNTGSAARYVGSLDFETFKVCLRPGYL
jgi:hypothetical protein